MKTCYLRVVDMVEEKKYVPFWVESSGDKGLIIGGRKVNGKNAYVRQIYVFKM